MQLKVCSRLFGTTKTALMERVSVHVCLEETGESSARSELYFRATPVGISMNLPCLVVLHEINVVQCEIVEIREGDDGRRRNAVCSIWIQRKRRCGNGLTLSQQTGQHFPQSGIGFRTHLAGREPWWLMGSTMSTWTWAVAPLVWQGTAVWWWRAVGVPPAA